MLVELAKTNKLKALLGQRIAQEREKLGWKQPDLAHASGISLDGLRQYEQKKRWPRPDEWERIASALKIAPGKLLEDPASVRQSFRPTPQQALDVLKELVENSPPQDKLLARVAALGPKGRSQLEKSIDIYEAADEKNELKHSKSEGK